MQEIIVLGAGVMGSTIAAALRAQGREVLLLDDHRSLAGTPASGGHLKPSWFIGMPKDQYLPAMTLLSNVWGLSTENYAVRVAGLATGASTTIHRLDTSQLIEYRRTARLARVLRILYPERWPLLVLKSGEELHCRMLVVCTGTWVAELLTQAPPVQAKQGVSFLWPHQLSKPFLEPWAPYKQLVAHQQSSQWVWIGDGTAVLTKNWSSERTASCSQRCQKALGSSLPPLTITIGLRPYMQHVKTEPCLLKQIGPRCWLASGAGKLGTIAAGWCAWKLSTQEKL